jgi:amino acid transporter
VSLRNTLFGKPKNPLDPRVFHQVSLVAFLAWVGLGADGLSSSAYGPEEAYLALGDHFFLALPLAILMAITVFIISASYSHIIELFPTGGGGYLVATKLLGPKTGLISGSALIVDYMLTITISVASAGDQIFSFLPVSLHGFKLAIEFTFIFLLIYLNLRGTKESVLFLLPIFLLFVIAHIFAISLGIIPKAAELPLIVSTTYQKTVGDIQGLGLWATVFIVLHAYSLGGGTYTGIEAVSNGLQVLREPRVATGKKTMLYMATSLAFTASGLLLCYLLNQIAREAGKTLNATLFAKVYGSFFSPESAYFLVILTLVTEAAILLVAAQAGYIDGPRVLSNMAVDSWVPHRFSHLSDKLVTQYGVWFMGFAALAFLLYTGGDVRLLVVMYAINVFLTFSISQLGMCRHWCEVRHAERLWLRRLFVNGLGLMFTATILVVTIFLKFAEGGWITLLVTSVFILVCYVVRSHYDQVRGALKRLDDTLINMPFHPDLKTPVRAKNSDAATAVLIVRDFDGLAIHSLLSIGRLFPDHFKNIVFVSIGLIDSGRFKGLSEIENLRRLKEDDLKSFVEFANCLGWYAEYRYRLGVDVIEELEKVSKSVVKDFPASVFFAGKLVFERENFFTRLLHNHTPFTLEQRLQFEGLEMMILPVRVFVSPHDRQITA